MRLDRVEFTATGAQVIAAAWSSSGVIELIPAPQDPRDLIQLWEIVLHWRVGSVPFGPIVRVGLETTQYFSIVWGNLTPVNIFLTQGLNSATDLIWTMPFVPSAGTYGNCPTPGLGCGLTLTGPALTQGNGSVDIIVDYETIDG